MVVVGAGAAACVVVVVVCGLGLGLGLRLCFLGLVGWCSLTVWVLVVRTAAVLFGAVVCEVPVDPQPAAIRASAIAPSKELLNPFVSILNKPRRPEP